MQPHEKQDLNALYFGNEWHYVCHRIPIPAPPRSKEPWYDEFTIMISREPLSDSDGIDTSVLNNVIRLVDAGKRGLALNESLRLVWHWLDRHDITWQLVGPRNARRIAILEDCVVRFKLAAPGLADAA